MRKIEIKELREIQMSILDGVDKFCKEKNIKYSISGGTLLGAIRHKGFIPWDDDIDISMLREDYSRFEREFPDLYDGHLCFASLNRRKDWTLAFGKVYDMRTEGQKTGTKSVVAGVNIDVFPIDDVPDSDEEWALYNKKRRSMLVSLRRSCHLMSRDNTFLRNIKVLLYIIWYAFTDRRKLTERIDSYAQSNNNKGYSRVFENAQGMTMKNNPFEKKIFDEIVDIPFENRLYRGFRNYDAYLSRVFGDYMTPPPMEKRKSSHHYNYYWKDNQ